MRSNKIKLIKSYLHDSWCNEITRVDCPTDDISAYIQKWGLKKKGKFWVKMYKTVRENDTSFHSSGIHYEKGKTIVCPDWDENYNGECGRGIHLSPRIEEAEKYNQGKHKSFWVDIRHFKVYVPNLMKIRGKIVKVID